MTCLLLLVVLLQTFSKVVTYVDFCVNRDYIARNLCENRDKPMMHCGGRCVLRKRLARQDNEDKSNPEKKDKETTVLLFCKALPTLLIAAGAGDAGEPVPAFSDTRTIDRPGYCFHPPD
ncbi:MAG TPA: hypothetical protein VHW43_06405 [Puia sp.]|nr:hypothetical protein [Puia sp.]